MEACDVVEKEIDKVIQKFSEVKSESAETINEIISVFSVILNSLGKFCEIYFEPRPVSNKSKQLICVF